MPRIKRIKMSDIFFIRGIRVIRGFVFFELVAGSMFASGSYCSGWPSLTGTSIVSPLRKICSVTVRWERMSLTGTVLH